MYKHILIPTDGSDLSDLAISKTVALAGILGAKVTVLTVTEPFHVFSMGAEQLENTRPDYERYVAERSASILSGATAKAEAAGVETAGVAVESASPYQAIIDAAVAHGCDLIAMASHGRSGLAGLVLGSETVKVLTHSAIPVLVYRSAQ